MERSSAAPMIISALIIGASILAGAVLVEQSLRRTTAELASLRGDLEKLTPPAPPPRPTARRGPDPNRRYSVDIDGAPSKGPEDARVTLVEFSDFQCPFCSRVNPTLKRLTEEYGDDVRVVFKHLPLSIHPKAPAAHAAAEAAHRQGKFWEMHDAIFADQGGMSPERYVEYAQQIGLDVERFQRDLQDREVQGRVAADIKEAEKLGVSGTPAFFVNGRYLSGALPYESFKQLVEQELKG